MTAPKLRLAGFKEPWNSGVVSRLLVERKELAPQSKQYPLMAFVADKGVASKGDRYDRSSLVKDVAGKLYKRTEKGDFIYSSNNLETGSIGLNKYGKACISPVYGIFCPTCDSDSEYIGVALCRKKFIQEMVKWRQGVVYGQWRIHEDDFLGIPVPFPDGDEQRAMGCYFASLDRLIEAESLRLESLRKLKVACLEKMFVQDEEKCPRLRLGEFKDDWKECHLGDVASFRRGLTYSPNDVNGKGVRVLRSSNIVGDHFELSYDDVFVNMDAVDIPCANDGDILITAANGSSALIGKHCVINGVASNSCVPGGFMVLATPRVNSWYLNACMSSSWYRNRIRVHSAGGVGTITNLNKSAIEEFVFSMPQSTQEQNAIGEFFEQLDKALRLLISEIGRLREMKLACMERMFV